MLLGRFQAFLVCFDGLIEILQKKADQGAKELPLFDLSGSSGKLLEGGVAPTEEALCQLLQLATNYQDDKAKPDPPPAVFQEAE